VEVKVEVKEVDKVVGTVARQQPPLHALRITDLPASLAELFSGMK